MIVLGGLLLATLAAASAARPYTALRYLLILLPLHSGAVLTARNVLEIDGVELTMISAWKEAAIAGLLVGAVVRARHDIRSLRVVHWLGVALVALIAGRALWQLLADGGEPIAILFGARQLGEFVVVLISVAVLRPSVAWFRTTALLAVPVLMVCTLFAIAQPPLGAGLYDQLYHAPGERLHHAYLVNIGDMRRFRAAGTFVAPNELGLGLVVYGAIFLLPLLAVVRRWQLIVAAAMLMGIALVLSFSRSAWVGAFVGLLVTAVLAHRHLLRLAARGLLLRVSRRELLIGLGAAAASTTAVFVIVGGVTLFLATITGSEASAAGRGASIGGGLEATFDNPGGLGLGTAGPRALELTGSAVLTENWYLLYSIQLGVVALGVLLAFVVAAAGTVAQATLRHLTTVGAAGQDWLAARYQAFVMLGTLTALVAGLVAGLVIPSMLDLPLSIALWGSVAMVIGWMRDTRQVTSDSSH